MLFVTRNFDDGIHTRPYSASVGSGHETNPRVPRQGFIRGGTWEIPPPPKASFPPPQKKILAIIRVSFAQHLFHTNKFTIPKTFPPASVKSCMTHCKGTFFFKQGTFLDSKIHLLVPSSSTLFHHLSPTSSLPEMFLTVQKSMASRRRMVRKSSMKWLETPGMKDTGQ